MIRYLLGRNQIGGDRMIDEYARERLGVKIYFKEGGVALGTSSEFRGDYLWNEYRTIPEGATRDDSVRGMTRQELQAAGWRFIS